MSPALPQQNFEDLWTVADAARFLKVGKTWLYEACGKGTVPHLRLGGSIRFEPEQLRAWLKAQRIGPGTPPSATVLPLEPKR